MFNYELNHSSAAVFSSVSHKSSSLLVAEDSICFLFTQSSLGLVVIVLSVLMISHNRGQDSMLKVKSLESWSHV